MNALKCRTLGVHNEHARMLERLKMALYTAGSAIALTGAVRVVVLPHAVTTVFRCTSKRKNCTQYFQDEQMLQR